jgi:DegV family protein with EDD domain
MGGVAIVTDSTAYLPADVRAEKGIEAVSLQVHFPDGRIERELDMDLGPFYDELVAADELPYTTAPLVEDFVELYDSLLTQGQSVVSVHISSGISETCAMAREAVARLSAAGKPTDRVEIVDTAAAAMPLGLVVLAAAAGAAAGENSQQVVERVRAARQTVKNWFVLDSLEFLRRGGRVGGAAAWLGGTLKVKPILTMESEIRAVERVRTTERALERMMDYAHRMHASGADAWGVQHARNPEGAEHLVSRCERVFGVPPLLVVDTGPVVGIHTGPGLLGLIGIAPAWLNPEPAALAPS